MRYRYLIERGSDDSVYLTTITREDTSGHALSVADIETAKLLATEDPQAPDGITWKDPPAAWQPEAVLISQWLDDGVEESRDG